MTRRVVFLPTLAALALAAVPLPARADDPAEALRRLALAGDAFALREALDDAPVEILDLPSVRLAATARDLAFGDPAATAAALRILAGDAALAPEERQLALELAWTASLRTHRYADASRAAEDLLAVRATGDDGPRRRRALGILPLLVALGDAPPQTVTGAGRDRLRLAPAGAVQVEIQGRQARLVIDTGANLSVLRRSEAARLGLAVQEASIEVGTASGQTVETAVALAPTMRLGRALFNHVPFLVVDDAAVADAGAVLPSGVLGMPVLEELGELRFRGDGVLEIVADGPPSSLRNLAVIGLEPRVRVRYDDAWAVCRLDTGAEITVFFEPFYHRHRRRIETLGKPFAAEVSGLAGSREVAAFRLPSLTLELARLGVTVRPADVYTEALGAAADPDLYCNLGLDVLSSRRAWVLSFKEMALALE